MYQTGQTIKMTLDEIHRHDLVLPAIQREFVWQAEQICRLFDSLMQGFPFGTFLYWRVDPENSAKFKFFDFVRQYHERDNPHCPPLPEMLNRKLTAVLDGQQRLTALNIGLTGSLARKLPHKWRNNPGAYPVQRLHMDLLWQPDDENDDNLKYRFSFLTDEKATTSSDETCWFRVGDILSFQDAGPAITEWLTGRVQPEDMTRAHRVLYKLFQVVHSEKLIAFYEEKSQELDKALQIFIRMNDGGTPLSHSDLLLSIAVAQWVTLDARKEIHDLVDEMNRIGTEFSFSQDLVLKAGLMLSDIGSVGFRVDNFSRKNMAILEKEWEDIKRALILTVHLISSYGFNGQNLTAQNAILPIAYYLHTKNPGQTYLTGRGFGHDRQIIRDWLIRSLLKTGVWGSGLDTLLTEFRRIIKEESGNEFPIASLQEAMARRGRPLLFDDEEIEDLVDMKYGDRLTFALLSVLFPFVNMRNQFHVDHIFPARQFTDRLLRRSGIREELIPTILDQKDRLANLQLLEGAKNIEKSAKMPGEWLSEEYGHDKDRGLEYRRLHLLDEVPDSITGFGDFYEQRRASLRRAIADLLGRQPSI